MNHYNKSVALAICEYANIRQSELLTMGQSIPRLEVGNKVLSRESAGANVATRELPAGDECQRADTVISISGKTISVLGSQYGRI